MFNVSKSQIIKIYENFEEATIDINTAAENANKIFIFSSIEVTLLSELSDFYALLRYKRSRHTIVAARS
jgi:hypothetical protein